ncbi:MAG: tripartite tricarboxylate transporter substrate binding protein [Deltaproteobacteria bacterium]|nr:MAG: tripartite tricarboxylate transporter substrate binding protein [Deltaproteobacteria bacterium]
MRKRKVFSAVFALALLVAFVLSAGAAPVKFPTKPITIVVPYSAGGGTDLQARALASVADKYFGQPVVVVTKPGGGGAVGAAYVARSKPDGYTLLYAVPAVVVIKPYMVKTPYSFDDLEPLMRVSDSPRILVVGAQQPWKTLEEFLDYAKKHPGAVKYGSAGPGTTTHIAMEGFAYAAGIKLTHVPFKGCAKAIAAVLGGHVAMFGAIPSECYQYIKAGQMRALAVFSKQRLPELPDVPTLIEKGINFSDSSTRAFFLPKGVPPEVKKILHDGFKQTLEDKSFKALFKKLGEPISYMSGDEFRKILEEQKRFYGEVLEKIGLKKY